MLPETLLVEALETARHHSMSSSSANPAWEVLAKLLSKVSRNNTHMKYLLWFNHRDLILYYVILIQYPFARHR